jgi:chemotaxis protein methyltransferase CheR
MRDPECVDFLQWALPRLRLRWAGFRKVRGQVCKRIGRRMAALGLPDAGAYRAHLDAHPDEWAVLDGLCRVTISRFHRDRGVFEELEREVLPALARRTARIRAWSLGCASGEEPYTLAILWRLRVGPAHPGVQLQVVATDADERLIERAHRARYEAGTLRELPEDLRDRAFLRERDGYRLRDELRADVDLRVEDVRRSAPPGPFHLVLCRNVVFTYLDEALQREVLDRIEERLDPDGFLVLGRHESPPPGARFRPRRPGSSVLV